MLTRAEIQRFPKAELHCHLDGSIRPHTLRQIARSQGMAVESNLMELTRKMVGPRQCRDLSEYLQTFDFVLPFLQTVPALQRAAYDVMEQAHQDGVCYIELRFAPSLSTQGQLTIPEAVQAVAAGIAEGERTYGIKGNLIVCGMRTENGAAVHHDFEQLDEVRDQLVGIDLAGPESDDFVPEYEDALQAAVSDLGVQLTLHAGECGCAHNVVEAVQAGSQRIGHGIAANGDETVERLLADRQICIEGCPTSNCQTGNLARIEDYPLQRWLGQGQALCINTDNRTVSDTTLTEEYFQLAQHNGLTKEQLRRCNQTAMRHSFADPTTKATLLEQITAFEADE
ncbi:adenosine deaminase [Fructilactobacillus myrtifloralis]|uniref:adenosine deaminase n=1 Tax=Fructilactobacillus myrtifloralis TaxID=2940301 RepID=A0ABY5BRN0_9LACO|nr:adenosine deaminase [Fructilactobacillus myrtifloralis]USS85702.1 adenosine deaminase [Fructilactobacillus myrtifloralis]